MTTPTDIDLVSPQTLAFAQEEPFVLESGATLRPVTLESSRKALAWTFSGSAANFACRASASPWP